MNINRPREFWIVIDTDGDFIERPYASKKEAIINMIKGEQLVRLIEKSAYEKAIEALKSFERGLFSSRNAETIARETLIELGEIDD